MAKLKMPRLDEKDFGKILNSAKTRKAAEDAADKLISLAKSEYLSQVIHPNTTTPAYVSSFRKSVSFEDGKYTVRVYNQDPTWKWIEFGAHARGRTRILRYKPMTRALQRMRTLGS